MARKLKTDTAPQRIAKTIIEEFNPKSFKELSDIVKQIYAPVLEEMLQAELDDHLGYESGTHKTKTTTNRRNGYTEKTVRSSQGDVTLHVPRDREGSFEPQVVPKRSRDISEIEDKVLSMYAKGMSQRDISDVIEDIYGFGISAETISKITDRVYPVVEEWRNRPLNSCYPFVFVDCLYIKVKGERGVEKRAVYVVLGIDSEGHKDVLGIWMSESESKHFWMQIFDELKARGVNDIFILSMDGLKGLAEGARAVFPDVVVQLCMVHVLRNSLIYVSNKERAEFCKAAKRIYGAINAEEVTRALKDMENNWSHCPGAVRVWTSKFEYVLQLFEFGSAVRKVMYTTNPIESVNSSLRKVTKKGAFPHEDAAMKAMFLRVRELSDKWSNRTIQNWSTVRNQLLCDERFAQRFEAHLNA